MNVTHGLQGSRSYLFTRMSNERQPINELHVNLMGKIFFAAAAAAIVGKACNLKVRGTPAEINAVQNALVSTQRFQEELVRPDTSVESVMQHLSAKHAAVLEFERVIGIPFPI